MRNGLIWSITSILMSIHHHILSYIVLIIDIAVPFLIFYIFICVQAMNMLLIATRDQNCDNNYWTKTGFFIFFYLFTDMINVLNQLDSTWSWAQNKINLRLKGEYLLKYFLFQQYFPHHRLFACIETCYRYAT